MPRILFAVLAAALLAAAAFGQAKADFRLSLIHVNDTHSKFEPSLTKLSLDIDDGLKAKPVYLELGGYPYLAAELAELRAGQPNPLVLHAGDFFQGTLYYTKYQGEADVAFWNLVRPDAATLGNHEFDKGPAALKAALLDKARFPIVDANVDWSAEPALKGAAVAPYAVLKLGGTRVGVIGATTPETPFISSPGKNILFADPLAPVQKAADALAKAGVDKVVLLSHLGYEEDLALAAKLRGVDVVLGGHSHTLLGDWRPLGLAGRGDYPSVAKDRDGNTVLVAQSWEWAKAVGLLAVDFDKRGHVAAWKAAPRLVGNAAFVQAAELPDPAGAPAKVRWQWNAFGLSVQLADGKDWKPAPADSYRYWAAMYGKVAAALARRPDLSLNAGDPVAWALCRRYALGVLDLQGSVVAQVGEDLKRGLNAGPGPIVADSMRAYAKTQVAITNAGGVRTDLMPGPLTTAQVYEVIPFGNTLVTCTATGEQLRLILEDAADFALAKAGAAFPGNPVVYVSGLRFSLDPAAPKGKRVGDLRLERDDGGLAPVDPAAGYTLAVNNYNAAGGDKFDALAALPGKRDTGLIDAEAFFAFVAGKTLANGPERIRIVK